MTCDECHQEVDEMRTRAWIESNRMWMVGGPRPLRCQDCQHLRDVHWDNKAKWNPVEFVPSAEPESWWTWLWYVAAAVMFGIAFVPLLMWMGVFK